MRLDFALPERRVGADVMGWDWRSMAAGADERQGQMREYGWRVAMFSGSQVLTQTERCLEELERLASGKPSSAPGSRRPPATGRRFSLIRSYQPDD